MQLAESLAMVQRDKKTINNCTMRKLKENLSGLEPLAFEWEKGNQPQTQTLAAPEFSGLWNLEYIINTAYCNNQLHQPAAVISDSNADMFKVQAGKGEMPMDNKNDCGTQQQH